MVSESGHSAHPDEIIASGQSLLAYIQKLQDDADIELKAWEDSIAARELAEKRRVAPGWLDSEDRILEPERKSAPAVPTTQTNLMDDSISGSGVSQVSAAPDRGAEDLDRAFRGLQLNKP